VKRYVLIVPEEDLERKNRYYFSAMTRSVAHLGREEREKDIPPSTTPDALTEKPSFRPAAPGDRRGGRHQRIFYLADDSS